MRTPKWFRKFILIFILAVVVSCTSLFLYLQRDVILVDAVYKGDMRTVRIAAFFGADVNANGGWALRNASEEGDIDRVKALLAAGANVNKRYNSVFVLVSTRHHFGETALMHAGNAEVAKALLAAGADVNAKADNGKTPLMTASRFGNIEVMKVLLDNKADVNLKNKDGNTALNLVREKGHKNNTKFKGQEDIAKLLIDAGADDSKTALMYASDHGHVEIVKALLAGGADVNAKDIEGDTALMSASDHGHAEAVKVLLAEGADVNAKNKDGKTGLMYAFDDPDPDEVVKILLDNKADVNLKDRDGKTALSLAREKGHEAIVKLLIDAGAKE